MTTAFSDPGPTRSAAVVARFHDELDDLDPRLWSMTDRELAHVLPALTRLRHRITALELAAAHQADTVGLGTEVGAADTGALLGQHHPADQGGSEAAAEARRCSRPSTTPPAPR